MNESHTNAAQLLHRARARSQTRTPNGGGGVGGGVGGGASLRPGELLARKQQLLSLQRNPSAPPSATPTGASAWPSADHSSNGEFSVAAAAADAEDLGFGDMKSLQSAKSKSPAPTSISNNTGSGELYALLARKEKDLQFAGELSKSLVEQNEALSRAAEKVAEDFSAKLELLEQEKHKQKLAFGMREAEFENRVGELQADCRALKAQLAEQTQHNLRVEKEKSKLVDELMQQNHRLRTELAETAKSESELSAQLQELSERFELRVSRRSEHESRVDALNDEICLLDKRKREMERRMTATRAEKAQLVESVKRADERLAEFERELRAKTGALLASEARVEELAESNAWLVAQVAMFASLNERISAAARAANDGTNADLALLDELVGQSNARRHKFDESAQHLRGESSATTRLVGAAVDTNRALLEPYKLLRKFEAELRARQQSLQRTSHASLASSSSSSDADDSGIQTAEAEAAAATVNDANDDADDCDEGSAPRRPPTADEWAALVDSLWRLLDDKLPCGYCELMILERAQFEALKKEAQATRDKLKATADQLLASEAQQIELRAQLDASQHKTQLLTDDLNACDSHANADELVRRAWQARDACVERKNQVQISLAKSRIEVMQISSQLMEAVQQKAELSQRLAQFEDDIHCITQESMRVKFSREEIAEQMRRVNASLASNAASNAATHTTSAKPAIFALLLPSFPTTQTTTLNSNSNTNNEPLTLRNKFVPSFATSKFNISKFWQRNSQQQKALDTTTTSGDKPTVAASSVVDQSMQSIDLKAD